MNDSSVTAQETEVAHQAAAVIAATLVSEIRKLGLITARSARGTLRYGRANPKFGAAVAGVTFAILLIWLLQSAAHSRLCPSEPFGKTGCAR